MTFDLEATIRQDCGSPGPLRLRAEILCYKAKRLAKRGIVKGLINTVMPRRDIFWWCDIAHLARRKYDPQLEWQDVNKHRWFVPSRRDLPRYLTVSRRGEVAGFRLIHWKVSFSMWWRDSKRSDVVFVRKSRTIPPPLANPYK